LKLEKLYCKLKSLVNDNVEIRIRDNVREFTKPYAEVVLVSNSNTYHWTAFRAETVEEALRKAIAKLRHPEKNYVDEHGTVWNAKDNSVYSANHIRTFLRNN
jgi:hypothetical protein